MPNFLLTSVIITGIGRTGPAHLVDIIKAGEAVSLGLSRRYYGAGRFELEGCRKIRTDRYVFKRDDSAGYVIVPEKILDKVVQWRDAS